MSGATGGRSLAKGLAGSVAVTLVALAVVELAARTYFARTAILPASPLALVFLAVAYSAFTAGRRAALVSASLLAIYAFYFLSVRDPLAFSYEAGQLLRATTISATGFALAWLVGTLKMRADASAARELAREREQALRLAQANRELVAANAVLEDFSHVVSHDLKEPLRGLAALHEALEQDHAGRLDDDGRELLRTCRNADRRLWALVTALLEHARATRLEVGHRRPVHVHAALASEGCTTRFRDLLTQKNGRVVGPAPEAPRVQIVPEVLELVLGNLVLNALKHNESRPPVVHVRAMPFADDQALVEIVVEDNGAGFSADSRGRLDAVLAGRNDARGVGTSGFGLLMVQRAVERFGGRVWLGRSREGGAAVHFTLPAAAPDAPPPPPAAPFAPQHHRIGSPERV